jgi:hypothetical protein
MFRFSKIKISKNFKNRQWTKLQLSCQIPNIAENMDLEMYDSIEITAVDMIYVTAWPTI